MIDYLFVFRCRILKIISFAFDFGENYGRIHNQVKIISTLWSYNSFCIQPIIDQVIFETRWYGWSNIPLIFVRNDLRNRSCKIQANHVHYYLVVLARANGTLSSNTDLQINVLLLKTNLNKCHKVFT